VATVNSSGTVVGVSIGRAIINAQAVQDQVNGTSTIDVVQVPVARVDISPAGAQTVFQGLSLQLATTLRDASGNILTGRAVSWTTSNPSVATVSSSGLVAGVALGTVQITAESEGVLGFVTVSVQPRPVATVALSPSPGSLKVGSQLQLNLDLRDSNGNQLSTAGRTVTWDSSNKPVATVQDGVVTGVSTGNATITVTVDGKPASAVVSVTP
jgi:trimeric autotransporter adhesin